MFADWSRMEALESIADIDAEIYESIAAFEDMLGHKCLSPFPSSEPSN